MLWEKTEGFHSVTLAAQAEDWRLVLFKKDNQDFYEFDAWTRDVDSGEDIVLIEKEFDTNDEETAKSLAIMSVVDWLQEQLGNFI